MHLSTKSTAIALATLQLGATFGNSQQLRPIIRADTNRDGVVNEADDAEKATWTSSRGAIFLPNVGDALGRCAIQDLKGNPLSNRELGSCSDASGDVLFEPSLIAPLKTAPLDVASGAFGRIYASPDTAAERVRLFVNDGPVRGNDTSSWTLLDDDSRFNATQLKAGLTLGIDGREFVKNATRWDGKVRVHFDVHINKTVLSDTVEMKVAPVLTHHHLQRVDALVSTRDNGTDPVQKGFLRQLDKAREAVGLKAQLYLFNDSSDIWAQDFFEPAYASMPGPKGPISIRIMLRSAQAGRDAGRQVFGQLRGKGVGGFQPLGGRGGDGFRSINSYGNLETIPPHTSRSGKKYPVGRIIIGKHFNRTYADSLDAFLQGQEIQKPLVLETGWLIVGHVDEFVQFLPSNKTGLGFTIAIADTGSAIGLLRNASATGHGKTRAVSFNGTLTNPLFITDQELSTTVDEVLANKTFHEVNAYAQQHIDANLETLLAEIPLKREDVIRVPALFKRFAIPDDPRFRREEGSEDEQLIAFSPAAVNGIVIGQHYLAPKSWGPVVDGVDVFERAVREAYAKAGMQVGFVDDFLSHHLGGGEIHCGSNTFRETAVKWWV